MRAAYYARSAALSSLLPEVLEVAQLALDLGVDVQRLLALARTALVAGDDELADLLAQRGVGLGDRGRALLGSQPLELRLDVERRLAAGALAVGLGLEQLAQLGVGLSGGCPSPPRSRACPRRGRSRTRPTARPCRSSETRPPAPSAKTTAAIGIATKTTIRITSPLETPRGITDSVGPGGFEGDDRLPFSGD